MTMQRIKARRICLVFLEITLTVALVSVSAPGWNFDHQIVFGCPV